MKMTVCAIRDIAAGIFNRPFFVTSQGMAMRSFQDEVNRAAEDNTMFNHPDDFELYELGEYDDADASFALHKAPKPLATAKQLKLSKS